MSLAVLSSAFFLRLFVIPPVKVVYLKHELATLGKHSVELCYLQELAFTSPLSPRNSYCSASEVKDEQL